MTGIIVPWWCPGFLQFFLGQGFKWWNGKPPKWPCWVSVGENFSQEVGFKGPLGREMGCLIHGTIDPRGLVGFQNSGKLTHSPVEYGSFIPLFTKVSYIHPRPVVGLWDFWKHQLRIFPALQSPPPLLWGERQGSYAQLWRWRLLRGWWWRPVMDRYSWQRGLPWKSRK